MRHLRVFGLSGSDRYGEGLCSGPSYKTMRALGRTKICFGPSSVEILRRTVPPGSQGKGRCLPFESKAPAFVSLSPSVFAPPGTFNSDLDPGEWYLGSWAQQLTSEVRLRIREASKSVLLKRVADFAFMQALGLFSDWSTQAKDASCVFDEISQRSIGPHNACALGFLEYQARSWIQLVSLEHLALVSRCIS